MPHGVCVIPDPSGKVFTPTAGYTSIDVPSQKWNRAYRLACSADLIEQMTRSLIDRCLPESYYVILSGHWYGDSVDTYLSSFLSHTRINAALTPHFSSLIHDGMVGFGFAWYDSARHEEIYVDDHKELTVLTSKPDIVEATFKRYGLTCIEDLKFISENGHAHTNLGGPSASYCHEIIGLLEMEKQA